MNTLDFLSGVWRQGVAEALPVSFAALGETLTERAGVVNIGIEGLMLAGALAGVAGAAAVDSAASTDAAGGAAVFSGLTANGVLAHSAVWAGLACGAAAGACISILFSLVTVIARCDQIIAGLGVNLICIGLTGVISQHRLAIVAAAPAPALEQHAVTVSAAADIDLAGAHHASVESVEPMPALRGVVSPATREPSTTAESTPPAPSARADSNTPARGRRSPWPRFAGIDPAAIFMLLVAAGIWLVLFRTMAGLGIQAVGEKPAAADTAGISVTRVRLACIAAGGALAGLGGAYLSVVVAGRFQEEMTAGRGFLALALVIFGRWSPLGVVAATLFFGCLIALQQNLQPLLSADQIHTLYPLLLMSPYVLTLLVLALTGSSRAPAALGQPYRRG